MESTIQNNKCERTDKWKQPLGQDKVVPPKPINDKAGSDAYLSIEDEDEEVTSPPRQD